MANASAKARNSQNCRSGEIESSEIAARSNEYCPVVD
jgi:hypothetical protein